MKDQKTDVTYEAWLSKYGGYANGMTLRDHFAGLAMQSLLAGLESGKESQAALIPAVAYQMADEMLKARGE